MAPVVPAPCWASRYLMPGVPTQPARRQRTPPAARRPPRRYRTSEAVAQASRPRHRPRRVKSPAIRIRPRQTKQLRRTCSEPLLPSWSEENQAASDAAASLPRFSTCVDLCSPGSGFLSTSPSSPSTSSSSPALTEKESPAAGRNGRYTDDSKVVINVTVEGCSGPVRALVRLGATVEETIGIVTDIYRKEGRRPRLENGSAADVAGCLELYQSYFCLQGLSKSDRLGDVGGRSFYMRRGGKDTASSCLTQTLSAEEIAPDGRVSTPVLIGGTHTCLIVSFLVKRLAKIARRGRKIWNMLGCIASD